MDESFDKDDTYSLPDFSVNEVENRVNEESLASQEREHERMRIEQRFLKLNIHIDELTSSVRTLTKRITSNPRERNELNTLETNAESRFNSYLITIDQLPLIDREIALSRLGTKVAFITPKERDCLNALSVEEQL